MIRFHLLLASVAAAIATIVAVVILHDPAPAPADPFEGLHLSAPEYDELENDEVLNSPIVSYQSDSFGYKIKFPGNWTLDDSRTEFSGDVLSDPSERVVITISETEDASLLSAEGMQHVSNSIRESLRFDPAFELLQFQRLVWKERATIFTAGVRKIGGQRFHTREYNIFRPKHGGILNISITTQEDAEALYEEPLQEILRSLDVCPEK